MDEIEPIHVCEVQEEEPDDIDLETAALIEKNDIKDQNLGNLEIENEGGQIKSLSFVPGTLLFWRKINSMNSMKMNFKSRYIIFIVCSVLFLLSLVIFSIPLITNDIQNTRANTPVADSISSTVNIEKNNNRRIHVNATTAKIKENNNEEIVKEAISSSVNIKKNNKINVDATTAEIKGNKNEDIVAEIPSPIRYFDGSILIPSLADSISVTLNLLDSILHQTVYPREVVIVVSKVVNPNDAAYLEVKRKWESSLSGPSPLHNDYNLNIELKWITVKQQLYAHQARNRAATEASSSYLCPFDSDDIMHPRRMEIIEAIFKTDESVDLVLHDYVYVKLKDLNKHHKNDYATHYMSSVTDGYDLNVKPQKIEDPFSYYPPSRYTPPMKEKFGQIFPRGITPAVTPSEKSDVQTAIPYFPSELTIIMKKGTSETVKKPYGARELLSYHNAWPSMKKNVWEAHPQCDKHRTDQECNKKEDSLQTMDIMADSKFNVMILPLKLGIYTHK